MLFSPVPERDFVTPQLTFITLCSYIKESLVFEGHNCILHWELLSDCSSSVDILHSFLTFFQQQSYLLAEVRCPSCLNSLFGYITTCSLRTGTAIQGKSFSGLQLLLLFTIDPHFHTYISLELEMEIFSSVNVFR